jgi:hypothetical protein
VNTYTQAFAHTPASEECACETHNSSILAHWHDKCSMNTPVRDQLRGLLLA